MGAITHADAGAPDVIVEFAQQLLALILGLVVVEAGEAGQLVGDRVLVADTGVVLIPGVLQTAAVEAQAEVVAGLVIAAKIAQPGRIDGAAVKGHEAVAVVARQRLAHGVQAPALDFQACQAGVLQGPAGETFRQQARVAEVHHRGGREHVTKLQLGIEQARLEGAAQLAEVAGGIAIAVHRQHVERTAPAAAAIAAVELEGEHGVSIQAKTHGALGITRLETGDKGLGPGFGVAGLAGGRLFAFTVVAVEIEVTAEHRQAAVFDKAATLGLADGIGGSATGQGQGPGKTGCGFVPHLQLLIFRRNTQGARNAGAMGILTRAE
ncbi:hypothetical protein D3C79_711680 [compost metagenome]